ncbi:hypothetical protein EJ02DRAFT_299081, partial [Clathrospora elynae]
GEELDDTCIVDKMRKKRGCIMFWGCFSDQTNGAFSILREGVGPFNKESYCECIITLVHRWLCLHPSLNFIQNGAPTAYNIEELQERDVVPIFWPAFSPNLNPIEAVWNRMKDYI